MVDMDFLFLAGTIGMVAATIALVVIAAFSIFRKS